MNRITFWFVIIALLTTGCGKLKETFTSPPHGDSWASYHAYEDCVRALDHQSNDPKHLNLSTPVAIERMEDGTKIAIYDEGGCAD